MWLGILSLLLVQMDGSCEKSSDINKEKKTPVLIYSTGNSKIYVFDDLINPLFGDAIKKYLLYGDFKYSYFYPDPYENMPEIPESGNLHCKAFISPSALIKTRLWKGIRGAWRSLPNNFLKGRKFLPYEVSGSLLRRGDFTVSFKGDEEIEDKIFIRIFLTKKMNKNAYSDQTFYDNNDEIVASVQPKPYRIIVWTGNVTTLFRPPSMGFSYTEQSLFLKLTADEKLFASGVKKYEDWLSSIQQYKKQPFPFKNAVNQFDYQSINISEKLLGKYYDRNGHIIGFFDNVFPKELVDAIRTYYTHYHSGLSHSEHDNEASETNDNVNFIYQFQAESVLNTPYIEMIKRLGAYLSNNTEWYPYDVSCNLIQHTHHTRIHIDCLNEEFEFTFLMYLNPNWNEDMYAETSFYQFDSNTLKLVDDIGHTRVDEDGLEMYDLIAAVIPKFGRIAMFRNLIPHSARPPAPNFLAARYTFPVKVAEHFRQGRAKMLSEALDYKLLNTPENPLYAPLREGDYDAYLQDDKRAWVEEHLQLMREDRKKSFFYQLKTIENILFPEKFKPKRDLL